MLSDPDGGGLDPKILKHRDSVQVAQTPILSDPDGGGTAPSPQISRDIERMVAQNPILSDPDGGGTVPHIQG
jgi:hypothetical protein